MNASDIVRFVSLPFASSVTVSALPLSHSAVKRSLPDGYASTQAAVSISDSTFFETASITVTDAAGVMFATYSRLPSALSAVLYGDGTCCACFAGITISPA